MYKNLSNGLNTSSCSYIWLMKTCDVHIIFQYRCSCSFTWPTKMPKEVWWQISNPLSFTISKIPLASSSTLSRCSHTSWLELPSRMRPSVRQPCSTSGYHMSSGSSEYSGSSQRRKRDSTKSMFTCTMIIVYRSATMECLILLWQNCLKVKLSCWFVYRSE